MKFKWTHCEVVKNDINMRVYFNERPSRTVGWVQPIGTDTGVIYAYRSPFGLPLSQAHPTKLQAMRALRRATQMHIIAGGKIDGLDPT